MIARFLQCLSNFKNWIFYSLEHNFWSCQPNLINDPSKFKFILPLSNAKELILWKFIEIEKIHFKERNFFLGHPVAAFLFLTDPKNSFHKSLSFNFFRQKHPFQIPIVRYGNDLNDNFFRRYFFIFYTLQTKIVNVKFSSCEFLFLGYKILWFISYCIFETFLTIFPFFSNVKNYDAFYSHCIHYFIALFTSVHFHDFLH